MEGLDFPSDVEESMKRTTALLIFACYILAGHFLLSYADTYFDRYESVDMKQDSSAECALESLDACPCSSYMQLLTKLRCNDIDEYKRVVDYTRMGRCYIRCPFNSDVSPSAPSYCRSEGEYIHPRSYGYVLVIFLLVSLIFLANFTQG